MNRFEELLPCQLRGLRVLDALCRKAEKEDLQEAGGACIWPLATAMRRFAGAGKADLSALSHPGVEAFRALTRNHRDNTLKTQRAGGLAGWLADDSSVVPPDLPDDFK